MISQREVERKYKALMHDVARSDFYKIDLTDRVNCYKCDCGHTTKTIDVDAGVTPFMHSCEKCGSMARSSFFKDINADAEPTQEWYRPDLKEIMKYRGKEHILDHIFNGGLLNRKIKDVNHDH